MDKEQLKEWLYQRFINDDGEGWTQEQEERIEQSLQEIGEQYLKMFCKLNGLDEPELEAIDKMNSQYLIHNKYILREVEMLIGAATEEKIEWK